MNTADTKNPRRLRLTGTVVSNKMQKTIVVKVDRYALHPVVKKYVKKSVKFMAHDEKAEAKIGDFVKITETRPRSRLKRWVLEEVIKKASEQQAVLPE